MSQLDRHSQVIRRRIQSLTGTEQLRPQWGRLQLGAMLCHCADGCRLAMDHQRDASDVQPGFLSSALGRWLVIRSPLPWPKGKVAGPPIFFATAVTDFDTDRETLLGLIEAHAQYSGPWG